jgi:protein O-mannosyl-transferase
LIQVGDQAMADRYAYIPLIGIFVMVAYAVADLASSTKIDSRVWIGAAACAFSVLSFTTYRQLDYWSSNYALWTHTLAVTRNNFIAEDNLGGALVLQGKTDEAYPHFQAAAAINPRDPMSHSNLGAYLQEHQQFREAVEQYQTTIALATDPVLLASTYANLGTAYRELGDDTKTDDSYKEALRLNPTQYNAYIGLGKLRERQNKLEDAIANYSQAVALIPTDSGYMLLGHALEQSGRRQQALAAYQQALHLNPDSIDAQNRTNALAR